jgi:hypothetical protein
MGLLDTLEGLLIPGKRKRQETESLKEILCKRRDDGYLDKFTTPVVGATFNNIDGSPRQEALK